VDVAITVDDASFKGLMDRLGDVAKSRGRQILHAMALDYQKEVGKVFNNLGSRDGSEWWKPYSPKTLKMPSGTWRIRYGTDRLPYGTPGKKVPGARRYSAGSKLLQAGGMLRSQMSQIRDETDTSVTVGAHEKMIDKRGIFDSADLITGRPVHFITDRDRERFVKRVLSAIREAERK
jgi:hypothetical protein